jgi:hypothetical protein
MTGKINQNELDYAKQTQFPKKSNVHNSNFRNELQRKMLIGHLVKTNPIEPNFKAPAAPKRVTPRRLSGIKPISKQAQKKPAGNQLAKIAGA